MRSVFCCAVFGAIALAGAPRAQAQIDITTPGDPIQLVNGVNDGDANAGAPPAAEGVEHAIDNVRQKYLNFLDLGSGFIVTPSLGASGAGTIITGARFFTANDAMERDPASYLIEGATSAAGPWTSISSGTLALPTGRNTTTAPNSGLTPIVLTDFNQAVTFTNTLTYKSYRVTFPTLRDAATANSMQIAEVELLGTVVPEPSAAALALMGVAGWVGVGRRRR